MTQAACKAVVAEVGAQTEFAKLMKVSQQAVNHYVKRGYFPASWAKDIALWSRVPVRDYVHPDIAELLRIAS